MSPYLLGLSTLPHTRPCEAFIHHVMSLNGLERKFLLPSQSRIKSPSANSSVA